MFKKLPAHRVSELDLLLYEIWMFNQIQIELSVPHTNKAVLNACLESFLIHARNLIRFLEGNTNSRDNKDDLTCARFMDANGIKMVKIPVMLPQKLKEKINKHLSHLTVISTEEKLDWDCEAIRKSINYSLNHFFREISPRYFPTLDGKEKADFDRMIQATQPTNAT